MSTINGKKPIATKPKKPKSLSGFGNILDIPEDIQAEFDAKGLVGRWLDAKEVAANQGYSKRGWSVYLRPKNDSDKLSSFRFGTDPDGVIRRGTCILGVKTLEQVAEHKEMLEYEAMKKSGQKSRMVDEFKSSARSRGFNASVEESDDEHGE